jgi:hypothetical protein
MRTRQRKGGGILDEEAEGIIQTIFAEYRTDDHCTATNAFGEWNLWIPDTEDGQVPMAGEVMTDSAEDGMWISFIVFGGMILLVLLTLLSEYPTGAGLWRKKNSGRQVNHELSDLWGFVERRIWWGFVDIQMWFLSIYTIYPWTRFNWNGKRMVWWIRCTQPFFVDIAKSILCVGDVFTN